MVEYVVMIRYERVPGMHAIANTIETVLSAVTGVIRVSCDVASAAAHVWYRRGELSLADLVRELEMYGVRVLGVAQNRADAGARSQAATA